MEALRPPSASFVRVKRDGDPSRCRRLAEELAIRLGFSTSRVGEAGLVSLEMATNLLRHAQKGVMIVQSLDDYIELVSMDEGPGISDPRFFQDGHSSKGTMGAGFGTMKRLSNHALVDAQPHGTVIVCRLWADKAQRELPQTGAVMVGFDNYCGDNWSMRPLINGGIQIMGADGAGHGEKAAEASATAVEIFHRQTTYDPESILRTMHEQLRGSRGAAVTIANIHKDITFAGVGNVDGRWISDRRRGVSANPGTVGSGISTFRPRNETIEGPGTLVLASDGLKTAWSEGLDAHLLAGDPTFRAAILMREYRRGTDDALVIIHKPRKE